MGVGARIVRNISQLSGLDHTLLKNRDAENQHPIEAITGLADKLKEIEENSGNISQSELDKINKSLEEINKILGKTNHFECITSNKDQTVFTVQNKYVVGERRIEVFVNGIRLRNGIDFTEVDEYNIELLCDPFEAGTILDFTIINK